jgi:hypothetical protein
MYEPKLSPPFTTPPLLEISGLSRRQLQSFEQAGALRPLRRGRKGRGHSGTWGLMEIVGAAYGKAFLDANCDPSWAYAAAAWVARQHPGALGIEFAQGRTLLSLLSGRDGMLVVPYLPPEAKRATRLKAAQLNLQACYERTCRRAIELAGRLAEEEQARQEV